MSPTVKRFLDICGSVLAGLGIIFVYLRLREYGTEINLSSFSFNKCVIILSLVVVYGFSNIMLTFAWYNILEHFGVSVMRRWAMRTYGVSQIAKYIPGNFFHFAGRQSIGMSAGIPAWILLKSTVWEISLISFSGSLFVILLIPLYIPLFANSMSGYAFLIAISMVSIGLYSTLGKAIAYTCGWYILFLTTSGLIFIVLLFIISNPVVTGQYWLILGGSYVTAWLIGLLTPGAPAGMGVREFVLFFLLDNIVDESILLIAVLLGRIVTVGGDVLFFFASMGLNDKKNQKVI